SESNSSRRLSTAPASVTTVLSSYRLDGVRPRPGPVKVELPCRAALRFAPSKQNKLCGTVALDARTSHARLAHSARARATDGAGSVLLNRRSSGPPTKDPSMRTLSLGASKGAVEWGARAKRSRADCKRSRSFINSCHAKMDSSLVSIDAVWLA